MAIIRRKTLLVKVLFYISFVLLLYNIVQIKRINQTSVKSTRISYVSDQNEKQDEEAQIVLLDRNKPSTKPPRNIQRNSTPKLVFQPEELETADIFSIPKIKFSPEYRNPCFYEQRSGAVARKSTVERALTLDGGKFLRCVPFFMFAGFPKCGTTDLYERLIKHKYIASSFGKEPLWWSIKHYKEEGNTFSDYLDLFIPAAQKVLVRRGRCEPEDESSCNPLLIGDFSTRELLQERDSYSPSRNVWDQIYYINPNMKFLVVMRDPVERLYSDYVYFSSVSKSRRISPQHFHEEVVKQIAWWRNCVDRYGTHKCLYGTVFKGIPPLRVEHNICWEETFDDKVCAAFRLGFYYYYIKDWLETFPIEQFLFISTELYSRSTFNIINDKIVPFLNVDRFIGEEVDEVKYMPRQYPLQKDAKRVLRNKHSLNNEMLKETRILLENLYRESCLSLSEFLNDKQFLWYNEVPKR